VAAFRAQAGSWLADPPFSALVDRLLEASELFREVWESHSIEVLSSRERLFHHPVAGDLRLEQHNLTPSDHPGLHVVIYTPISAVEAPAGHSAQLAVKDDRGNVPNPAPVISPTPELDEVPMPALCCPPLKVPIVASLTVRMSVR
jgi:hypothetical protein